MSIKKKLLHMSIGFFIVSALIIVFMSVFFNGKKIQKPSQKSKQIKVVTSLYPLYFFTREIGKKFIQINNLTPTGFEPHDYEPTIQDIQRIEESNLLIVNGFGLEPWVKKLQYNLSKNHIKLVSVAEQVITPHSVEKEGKISDPHIWLDPVLAQQEVAIIAQTLIMIDPIHRLSYTTNSKILKEKLNTLDQDFISGLQNCTQKYIITSHNTVGYVSARYPLDPIAIQGIIPEQEPTPHKLAQTSTFAKKNNTHYIFFENLINRRFVDTVAKEIGAQTLLFNPIEGLTEVEQQNGADYFSVQRENLS